MRLLYLLHQYLPDHVGGTELYTHWLTKALQAQGQHQIAIFHRRSAPGAGLSHRIEAGIDIWSAWHEPFTPFNRFTATFTDPALTDNFRRVLDATRPELVHIQHFMGLPVQIVHELQRRGIPYVVTLWDFWWVCANAQLLTNDSEEICDGPRAYLNCARCALARSNRSPLAPALPVLALPLALRTQRLRRILSGAARLIAPAHFVRDWYAAQAIATDRLTVIPPGLDYPTDLRWSQGSWVGKRPFRIGYIGGLSRQKGVHVLVEAFQNLAEDTELWLAGDPQFDPAYTASLQQLANARVRFLGRLNRAAIWRMLAQIDLVVVSSMWYETFCFVISEAFAAGVPVVATDLGVLAERVRPNIDGLLVPPGDVAALRATLQQVYQEPEQLIRLRSGIQPVLTMTDHAKVIYQEYRRLLADGPTAV